jgi:hypothetical protein
MTVAVAVWCGCGKKSATGGKDDAAAAKPAVAPLAMPTLGIDHPSKMNFIYDAGQSLYDKAVKAKAAKDWAGVKNQCEAALAKDPGHLDAHRLLGVALSQQGEHAAAVDHIVAGLAADYFRYGPMLADEDLKAFMATPHGQSVGVLAKDIEAEYARRIKTGLWLVARRSTFKWPKDPGVQTATSRGELYAFDRESKRYFRLTHTDHQVVGFVRAPSGAEVAVLGFDKIDKPKDDGAPLVQRAWVLALDTTTWKPAGPRATVGPGREITLGYGAGDQLLVSTAPATGRWTTGPAVVASLDKTTGKTAKVAAATPTPRIVLTLDEAHLVRAPDGTEAAWSGDPPTTTSFKIANGGTVHVPDSGQAAQSSLSVSPGGTHVAFATAVDPCAKDALPSLYVADAKSGALKHVLTARSRFATRWLDDNVVAYEDGDGAIRLWDTTTSHEALRLDDRAGLALDILSLAPGPLCKQAPPTVEAGSGSDDALPPEEGSSGPVTAPSP